MRWEHDSTPVLVGADVARLEPQSAPIFSFFHGC
jgi:hypothetical protein